MRCRALPGRGIVAKGAGMGMVPSLGVDGSQPVDLCPIHRTMGGLVT